MRIKLNYRIKAIVSDIINHICKTQCKDCTYYGGYTCRGGMVRYTSCCGFKNNGFIHK